jgi:hypothetical protein
LVVAAASVVAPSQVDDRQTLLSAGNSPITAGDIAGQVDEPTLDSAGNESISGWACVVGLGESISVRLFRGGTAADGGVPVATYVANMPTDAKVSRICEDSGVNHGFSIPIPSRLRTTYPGQRLYIYGVDPASQSNVLVASDGGTHIYATTIFQVEATDSDATNAIQTAINKARDYVWNQKHVANPPNPNAYAEVLLSAGVFKIGTGVEFDNFCFALNNSQNLVFGGAGLATKLIFQNPMAGGFEGIGVPGGINPENVTLIGFLMDELYPPYTQGTITSVNQDGGITIAIDPGMPLLSNAEYEAENNAGGFYGMIFNTDAANPHIKLNTPGFFCTAPDKPKPSDAITNSWKLKILTSPAGCGSSTPLTGYANVGDRYIEYARNGIGWMILFTMGTNITLDGVTIYAGPDIAAILGNNSGQLVMNDFHVRRSPDPQVAIPGYTMPGSGTYRAISVDGDMHLPQNWAALRITNSSFEYLADDAMNIFSIGIPVTPAASSITSFSYTSSGTASPTMVKVGDRIQVVDIISGAAIGEAPVSSIDSSADPTFVVSLSSAISGFNSSDQYVVFNLSAASPRAVIKNNVFTTTVQSHGLFCKCPGATISGNTFNGIGSAGIGLYTILLPGGSSEGPNPTNVTITNNRFSDGSTGAVDRAFFAGQISIISRDINWDLSKFLGVSNITIDSNTFSNYAAKFPPVYIGAAKNIFLNNNSVISPSGKVSGLVPGSTLQVTQSSNVELNGVVIDP